MKKGGAENDCNVKVTVRCRPLSSKEKENANKKIVDVNYERGEIQVFNPNGDPKPKSFTFDFTYSDQSHQKDVYDQCASKMVTAVLDVLF